MKSKNQSELNEQKTATYIYNLSLHDALPIYTHDRAQEEAGGQTQQRLECVERQDARDHEADERRHDRLRSEEHTSELQSHVNLVCRLLLEKKKKIIKLQ